MRTLHRLAAYILISFAFGVVAVVLFALIYRFFGDPKNWFPAALLSAYLAVLVPVITFAIYYLATRKDGKEQIYFGTLFIIFLATSLILSIAGNVILNFLKVT